MLPRLGILFFPFLVVCLAGAWAPDAQGQIFKRKNARIMIDARATDEYAKLKEKHPDGLIYNMMQGRYFGGYTRDTSLEQKPFSEIAVELAERMEQQGLFVAANIEEADLLLVVSWGTTDIPLDWSELFPEGDSGFAESEEEEIEQANESFAQSLDQSNREGLRKQGMDMAQLLGFDRSLRSKDTSVQEYNELQTMLQQERYFVVVQAFDFQKLRNSKEKVLLWSTRFSMSNAGVSFEDALTSLTRAATPYFGANMDDLSKEKTHIGSGEGKVGELEVIDVADDEKEIE